MRNFMNGKHIIFFIFLMLISIASVSASDINQTDVDFDKSDSECCSFVIQEEDETVFAFRQDSPINGYGVEIYNDTLGNLDIITQEIDTPNNHFIHAIITEDGWVASHGGDSTNVSDTRAIERCAFEMLLSKNISSDSLFQIQTIFSKYNYGHFLIKAPDGSYGIAYFQTCLFGTLNPGEFLVVPNEYDGFRQGNYTDYAINPIDAIVNICSYDNSGWNRRNVYSYDYKAHDTADGQKYGVDIYATNDNGHNVGLNTSEIVTYVYYNNVLYPKSVIPQNPDKLYLGTYIFENQSIYSIFEVVNSSKNVLVNSTSAIHYRINNIDDERTIVFDLDDNIEFIDAEISQGNYYYDLSQHALYWNLSPSNGSKEIILNIKPNVKGTFKVHSYVQDINEEIEVTAYATNQGVILTSENVTTYKSYSKSLKVYLTDDDGVALIGEEVSIVIDGTTYCREVTPKGYAALSIMLQPGEYDALISYDGKFGKNQTTAKIIVKKTLFSEDLEVFYGKASKFNVSCLDENGNILKGYEIDFCIDGVLKDIYLDENGTCALDISNLKPGNHSIISYNIRTNEFVSNLISIKEPICDLIIKKTVNASSIRIGDNVKWTIFIFNNGPCDAHEVQATDILPLGVKYVSYYASKGFYDVGCGLWTIGNLTDGENVTLDLYCIAFKEGIITNEANVTCNETDVNPSNNHDDSSVEVIKNETPIPPSPPTPIPTPNPSTEQPVDPVKMSVAYSNKKLVTGNPIACLLIVIMVLFSNFWVQNRKKRFK